MGNALFQQGQHAWALRTYLTGVQQLQLLGYAADDPEQIFGDARAWPVCTARCVTMPHVATHSHATCSHATHSHATCSRAVVHV